MAALLSPGHVDAWLDELDVVPIERAERDGVTSWDLLIDGRARPGIRITLILDPSFALLAWVHFAPPLNDSFRVSYRQFLRWNDELPFVKFGLSEDERPILTTELPAGGLDRDALGLALARLVAVCDLLLADSMRWLWPGRKTPPEPPPPPRQGSLLSRYAVQLAELLGSRS